MKCSSVITAHDEGLLLKPTLESIAAAARFLEERGGQWELIVVADRVDNATMQVATRFCNEENLRCSIIETSFGEPGPARNTGIAAAEYDWIAVHDGDELVCENWFHAALTVLQRLPKAIAHSHWSLVFGQEAFFWEHPDGNRTEWSDLEISNPWSVQCVAAKAAFIDVPYRSYRGDKIFEYEDWFWNSEVMRAGYRHIRVRDTVHGVRRKPISRDLLARNNRKILQSIWSSSATEKV